jgi:quinol monooxygenase YgiN
MHVPTYKIKELLQTLITITERIKKENGCIGCDIVKFLGDENRFSLIGKWKDEEDLSNHLQSNEGRVLLGAMTLLEKNPEIRLDKVSTTKRLEELQKNTDEQKSNSVRT